METNLMAIYVADVFAMTLVAMLFVSNLWRIGEKKTENTILTPMLFSIFLCGIFDYVSFLADGHPGAVARFLVYSGNIWLFICNMVIGYGWIILLSRHFKYTISKRHMMVLRGTCIVGGALLAVNFFVPIVFEVDEFNRYHRGPVFWLYLLIQVSFVFDGLRMYYRLMKKGGKLRFFPAWIFAIPLGIGVFLQAQHYGISTIIPCLAISFTGVMMGLQNEMIYTDKLTSLYNRSYLDSLKEHLFSRKRPVYTLMMLDINGFKRINDNYGHRMGDDTLIATGKVLMKAAGELGTAIRYAGDEFVILLNTLDEAEIQDCVTRVREGIEDFNKTKAMPFELSLSIGYCTINLSEQTPDEIMNMADKKMYEDKDRYYESHERYERTKKKL